MGTMDGRVRALRYALEEGGYPETGILSYAAKFASNFYGPFRDAVGSTQGVPIDKKTYQLDYHNSNQALNDALADVVEGADIFAKLKEITKLFRWLRITSVVKLRCLAWVPTKDFIDLKMP